MGTVRDPSGTVVMPLSPVSRSLTVPQKGLRRIGTERDATGEMIKKGIGDRARWRPSNQGVPVVLVAGQKGVPQ